MTADTERISFRRLPWTGETGRLYEVNGVDSIAYAAALEARLTKLEAERVLLEQDLTAREAVLFARVDEVQGQLLETARHVGKVVAERDDVLAALGRSEAATNAAREGVRGAKRERDEARAEIERLNEEIRASASKLTETVQQSRKVERERDEVAAARDAALREAEELRGQISQISGRMKQARAEHGRLASELSALMESISLVMERLQADAGEITRRV